LSLSLDAKILGLLKKEEGCPMSSPAVPLNRLLSYMEKGDRAMFWVDTPTPLR
jgi:hypothetical protein